MRFEISVRRKIDEMVPLLEEAASWLWERGIHQWRPGSIPAALKKGKGDTSRVAILGRNAGACAGGCVVSLLSPPVWQAFDGEAAYLSWLVVGRAWAGSGLAEAVMSHAEGWAVQNRLSRLRLDCWSGNSQLRRFYRHNGFSDVAIAPENDYTVALFEKTLSGPGLFRSPVACE